ncbi:unnamed protein product, partial [Dovyalis caffra]
MNKKTTVLYKKTKLKKDDFSYLFKLQANGGSIDRVRRNPESTSREKLDVIKEERERESVGRVPLTHGVVSVRDKAVWYGPLPYTVCP